MKNSDATNESSYQTTIDNLSKALFTVNRHAKTATDPKYLYFLKKKALEKLLREGKAKKCGLHFSNNPKFSQQRSDLLISVGNYYFHMPPTKEDFQSLSHLGSLDYSYRNPKVYMPLTKAKAILQKYTGIKPKATTEPNKKQQRTYQKPIFKRLGEKY